MAKILLVEDDILFSELLHQYLTKKGFDVMAVSSGEKATQIVKEVRPDLVLLDYHLPDTTGLILLQQWKKEHPDLAVILMTAYSDIRLAIEALKMGASDYIIKPIQHEELIHSIQQALNQPAFTAKNLPKTHDKKVQPTFVSGKSDKAMEVQQMLGLVATTPITVILLGESGTGKEYAARFIHQNSKRADQPFVAVDCGTLSDELAASELFGHVKGAFTGALTDKIGVFEHANGGTLFLDEIGNLSYEVQVMLLRVLQEKQLRRLGEQKLRAVDVRLLVATNEDLRVAVQKGRFREDLYHRLNEFSLVLPPLRERTEDLPIFMSHFLEQANSELEKSVTAFSKEVKDSFNRYNWPGNLRELRNIIKRCVLLSPGNVIETNVLPEEIKGYKVNLTAQVTALADSDLHSLREAQEEQLIREVLEKVKYNKSRAALMLNIDRKTLYAKLKKYGLD